MRGPIVALALLFAAGPASADSKGEVCNEIAIIAAAVAGNHQSGISLAANLAVADRFLAGAAVEAMREMIVKIYDRPRWSTEEMQQHEIALVRDRAHVECLSD